MRFRSLVRLLWSCVLVLVMVGVTPGGTLAQTPTNTPSVGTAEINGLDVALDPALQPAPTMASVQQAQQALISQLGNASSNTPDVMRRLALEGIKLAHLHELQAAQHRAHIAQVPSMPSGKITFIEKQARQEEVRASAARDEAMGHLGTIVQKHPSYSQMDEALFLLAVVFMSDGEDKKAKVIFTKMLREAPTSTWTAGALICLGDLAAKEGDLAEALTLYGKVTSVAPGNVEEAYAQLRLGGIQYEQGDRAQAVASFQSALQLAASLNHTRLQRAAQDGLTRAQTP